MLQNTHVKGEFWVIQIHIFSDKRLLFHEIHTMTDLIHTYDKLDSENLKGEQFDYGINIYYDQTRGTIRSVYRP